MPIPIPNADALRRIRDVVLRVEASPPGEALGAKNDGRPAQPFSLVTITSATKTDGRFPGQWLRFEDNAFGAGEETCWVIPTNDVALRVGRRYKATLVEYRSADGYPIFLVDRDSPRVGQVTLSVDESSWDLEDYDLVEVDVDAFSGPDTKTISGIAGGYTGREIKLWFKPLASSTRYVAFESGSNFNHGGNGLAQTTVTVAPNQGALVTVTYWDSKWFVSAELNFDAQYTGEAGDLNGGIGTNAGWAVMWGLNSRALWRGGFWGGNGTCGIARNHTFALSRLGDSPTLATVPGASETAWTWPTSSHVHFDYRAESAGSVIHGISFIDFGQILLVSVNAGSYSLTFKHQSGSNAASAIRCATGADIVMDAAHSMVLLFSGGDSGSGGDTSYVYALPLFGVGDLTEAAADALYDALGSAAAAYSAAASDLSTHAAASDPHTGYQKESEKASANGYASLDGTTKVPIAQIPTGSTSSTACIGNDSRLSDSRTPSAHKTSHQSGGSDAIKLDDLAAPDDNTDLNASTSAHGLLKKLDNNAAHFLDGQGNWSAPSTGAVDTGTVSMFAMAVPSGWLECDGSAVSRSTYSALFSAIGTVWGAGDGSTTFNVPDLRGRAPIGVGTGATLTARNLGTIGGAENHTLSTGEMPAHSHGFTGDAVLRYTGSAGSYNLPSAGTDVVLNITMTNTGGGGAHNNMQPWAALRFGIKT